VGSSIATADTLLSVMTSRPIRESLFYRIHGYYGQISKVSTISFLTYLSVDNVNRVQGNFVSQSRRRWFINVVLVLAVIGFVGFSLFPLISTAFKESQPSHVATPLSPSQPPVAGEKSQLEEQARVMNWFCREPENQTALRGLVQARIQLRDLKGLTLEKLTALNPTNRGAVDTRSGLRYSNYDEAIAV